MVGFEKALSICDTCTKAYTVTFISIHYPLTCQGKLAMSTGWPPTILLVPRSPREAATIIVGRERSKTIRGVIVNAGELV